MLQLGCCTGQSFSQHTYVNTQTESPPNTKQPSSESSSSLELCSVFYMFPPLSWPVVVCSAQVEAKTCQVVQQTAERNRIATIVFGGLVSTWLGVGLNIGNKHAGSKSQPGCCSLSLTTRKHTCASVYGFTQQCTPCKRVGYLI